MRNGLPIEVIQQFTDRNDYTLSPMGGGHINSTFQLKTRESDLVIQTINTEVFKQPELLMQNISRTASHLSSSDYPFQVLLPVQGKDGTFLFKHDDKYYRAYPFIKDSRVINKNPSPEEAATAASAFGVFASHLMNFNSSQIHHTISGFHDFEGRVTSLKEAVKRQQDARATAAIAEVEKTLSYSSIVSKLSVYCYRLPQRVLHSDPKINNILFEEHGKEVKCVIDLDTIMPGPIFYDLSDMIRSYTNLADEDEADLSKVIVSKQNLVTIIKCYLHEIKGQLTGLEWESMKDGYLMATYIQAVRFLTDYLNGDVYYQTNYSDHNLVRTRNQLHLLEGLIQLKPDVIKTISQIRNS